VRGLVRLARNLVVVSWFFYPVVYFLPFLLSLDGGTTRAGIEVGYTIADITAKAVFGLVIFAIAVRKSEAEGAKALKPLADVTPPAGHSGAGPGQSGVLSRFSGVVLRGVHAKQ